MFPLIEQGLLNMYYILVYLIIILYFVYKQVLMFFYRSVLQSEIYMDWKENKSWYISLFIVFLICLYYIRGITFISTLFVYLPLIFAIYIFRIRYIKRENLFLFIFGYIILFIVLVAQYIFPIGYYTSQYPYHYNTVTSIKFLVNSLLNILLPNYSFPTTPLLPYTNFCLNFTIDPLGLIFVALNILLLSLCLYIIIPTHEIEPQIHIYYGLLLCLITLLNIVFLAADILTFFLAFESILIPIILIIGIWGSSNKRQANNYLIFYTSVGAIPILLAIFYLWRQFGAEYLSFSIISILPFSWNEQFWLWLAFFISFAIKTPIVPVHLWLPKAHVDAPTAGSVILAGLLLKIGLFGFLRLLIPILPLATIFFAPYVSVFATIGVLYASAITLRQVDIKRIIAYSSIAHINIALVSLCSLNSFSILASIYLMLSHGIIASALFFIVGFLYNRFHQRLVSYYGGLASFIPIFTIFFFYFSLANIAFPITSGFIGEFFCLAGIMSANTSLAIVNATSILFTTTYSILLFGRVCLGNIKSWFALTENIAMVKEVNKFMVFNFFGKKFSANNITLPFNEHNKKILFLNTVITLTTVNFNKQTRFFSKGVPPCSSSSALVLISKEPVSTKMSSNSPYSTWKILLLPLLSAFYSFYLIYHSRLDIYLYGYENYTFSIIVFLIIIVLQLLVIKLKILVSFIELHVLSKILIILSLSVLMYSLGIPIYATYLICITIPLYYQQHFLSNVLYYSKLLLIRFKYSKVEIREAADLYCHEHISQWVNHPATKNVYHEHINKVFKLLLDGDMAEANRQILLFDNLAKDFVEPSYILIFLKAVIGSIEQHPLLAIVILTGTLLVLTSFGVAQFDQLIVVNRVLLEKVNNLLTINKELTVIVKVGSEKIAYLINYFIGR